MSVSRVAERDVSYDLPAMKGFFAGSSLDLVVSAPQGVAKLRELILSLGIQGKLLPQSVKDEPASEALRRVRTAKDHFLAGAAVKKRKIIEAIDDAELPFQLPPNWEWARLVDLVSVLNGRAYAKEELLSEGVPVLRVGNLFTSNHWYYSNLTLEPEKYCDAGDLLFAWSASFGPFIWPGPKAIYHYHIWKLQLYSTECFNKRYLYTFLLEKTQEIKAAGHGVSMVHMTKEKMEKIVVPIPPLAEQARIVARVEELMQLCDALEAHGRLQDEQHARLVATLFDALASSESAPALAENWQRIAAHFDLLLDRPEAVDALEQTILQLAIRGLLVSQDSSDEPAAALVAKIEREKVVVGGRRIRKLVGKLPPVGEGEIGFPAPAGWAYVRFGDVTINRDGERIPVSASDRERRAKSYDYYGASGVIDKIDGYLFDKRLLLIGEDGANLISRSTPIAFFAEGKYWVNNHAHVIDAPDPKILDYLCLYINAISLAPYVTGTAQPKMNQAKLNGIPVALPPLAEQLRIGARVEELRRLCANLRERLQQARSTQSRLADALVNTASRHAGAASVDFTH